MRASRWLCALPSVCRQSGILAEQLAAADAKVKRLELVAAEHAELQARVAPQVTVAPLLMHTPRRPVTLKKAMLTTSQSPS